MHKNGIKIIAALPKQSYLIFHSFKKKKTLNSKPAKKQLQVLALFSTDMCH